MDPRFRQLLGPASDYRREVKPPASLAARAIARVAEYYSRTRRKVLPKLRAWPNHGAVPGSRSWPRADVLLAVCLFIAVVGVLIPAVAGARQEEHLVRSEFAAQLPTAGVEVPECPRQPKVELIPSPTPDFLRAPEVIDVFAPPVNECPKSPKLPGLPRNVWFTPAP